MIANTVDLLAGYFDEGPMVCQAAIARRVCETAYRSIQRENDTSPAGNLALSEHCENDESH